MFITAHAAIATVIGRQVNNSLLAFLIGLISHFIFDLIPHGDSKLGQRFWGERLKFLKDRREFKFMAIYGSLDSLTLAFYLIFIFKNFEFARADNVIWAIIGSILPDVLVAIYKLREFKWLKWFFDFHAKNHNYLVNKINFDWPIKYGIVMQLILITLVIWLIYWL